MGTHYQDRKNEIKISHISFQPDANKITDHGITGSIPSHLKEIPPILRVKPGDFVIVKVSQQVAQQGVDDWWLGQVVFCEGGARDPTVNTMFQVSNVDDGGIHWVNGDEVTQILQSNHE